ncbi:MAG: hypothetical protein AB7V77_05480 [Candidatus Woesearchaeota archaeon]
MNFEKLNWCLLQIHGIKLIEPNINLSNSYAKEADETLENVFTSKGKWKTITAYYACYSAIYSILMRCGIKCEIHDCTLELINLFDFTNEEKTFIKNLKEDRINAQYFLKNIILDNEKQVKQFILKCKVILNKLNSTEIEKIRNLKLNLHK